MTSRPCCSTEAWAVQSGEMNRVANTTRTGLLDANAGISRLAVFLVAAAILGTVGLQASRSITGSSASALLPAKDIFISSGPNASDITGQGTAAKPFRSIAKALSIQTAPPSASAYNIKIVGTSYLLSTIDLEASMPHDSKRLLVARSNAVNLLATDTRRETIVEPPSDPPSGQLEFEIEGTLKITGLSFRDIYLNLQTKTTGVTDVRSNYFYAEQACHPLQANTQGRAKLTIEDNKIILADRGLAPWCSGLWLTANPLTVHQAKIHNNYLEVPEPEGAVSPQGYRAMFVQGNRFDITDNKFKTMWDKEAEYQAVGVFAANGSKPMIGKNDFSDFDGVPVVFE